MNAENVTVSNNEKQSRFECSVEGRLCRLDYELRPGVIVLRHTEVPRELGGRGLAGQLVQTALEHARAKNLRVVPECTYVQTFIKRHPQYNDLIAAEER